MSSEAPGMTLVLADADARAHTRDRYVRRWRHVFSLNSLRLLLLFWYKVRETEDHERHQHSCRARDRIYIGGVVLDANSV
jgi:hypothetical protein